jgi:hypothetical protein
MSPSMDMVEKQSRLHKFTNFQHQKIKKDKTRLWRGNIQRKRLYVLGNPTKLAFRGWEEVPEPWTYANCKEYIEWCHFNKKIPAKAA